MDVDMAASDAAPPVPSAAAAAAPPPAAPTTPSPASAPSPGALKLAEPRRRNRPALSCIQCRSRKIRCDRNEPCASCMKSKIVNCTYEEARRPKPRLWRLSPAPSSSAAAAARHHHHSDHSPTSTDERAGSGPASASAFTFRDVALPAPLPTISNPACAGPGGAIPGGRTPEPHRATTSPHPLPQSHYGDQAGSVLGPLGSTSALAERIRQLEQQLADALKRPADYGSPPSRSSAHATLSPDRARPARPYAGAAASLVNGDKLFPLAVSVAERVELDKASEAHFLLRECRVLGRSIRAARAAAAVAAPLFELGKAVPPRDAALQLVEAYFRTFETVYRILHRPSFWQAYKAYWESPETADPAFVVQFQLCMAIGTCFQDDAVGVRRSAARWIHEAQVWLVSPPGKGLASIAGLQVMCLLHLARETCGVGYDLAWVSTGALLRTAMHLGLHRDPDNNGPASNMSLLAAEMRRRLWATVLEMVLQSSLDAGAPPLLSTSDFDTRPPSNYDDDQLSPSTTPFPPPLPRPPSCFTQTTVQLALLRSFPVRLAIAHHVNHFSSPSSFEETLKWNTDLTAACRTLSATFQPFYDPAGILPKRLSLFQLRLAEHLVHRFFLALNHPWLAAAHTNPAYYFARKMCVDTALKLYRAFATGSPAGDCGTASPSDDFTRLSTRGGGAFREVPTLAVLTLAGELLWQVQEDRGFQHHHHGGGGGSGVGVGVGGGGGFQDREGDGGPGMGIIASGAAPRQELTEAVRYSVGWAERRVRIGGEVNVKGYLLFAALLCQAGAVGRGGTDQEVERAVLGCVGEELGRCRRLLEEVAGREGVGREGNGGEGEGRGEEAVTRGFNSIFNIHDADFFIGT